jgi:2,4-dienoyl-CoA reductase-like NADH-dependent reductase (Old Yellow Enzyme family)
MAIGARITGTDWVAGGWTAEDAVVLARELKSRGVDFVCVSSGGVHGGIRVPVEPGYQVPLAARVREGSGIATRAVGLIVDAEQAERIVAGGQADMVAIARALLDNPRWVWHAADRLGARIAHPLQYARVAASLWPGAKVARPDDRIANLSSMD